MSHCNGICTKYRVKMYPGIGRYESGQKLCRTCEVYINWKGADCPCCRTKLRVKRRSTTGKKPRRVVKRIA